MEVHSIQIVTGVEIIIKKIFARGS